MIPSVERFEGALIGQCLGDALGFVVEGRPHGECATYAHDVVRAGHLPHLGRQGFAFGQYSDESQMARALMRSYLKAGGFDPAAFAERIAAQFAEDRMVGRGVTTTQAAQRLVAGIPWDEAGTPPPLAGNASAIRAMPVGLLFGHDPDRMIQVAHDQSRITHADPRCSAGAVAVAGAVALAAAGGALDPAVFLRNLRDWCSRIEPVLASGLRQLQGYLDLPEAKAAEAISRAGVPPGVDTQWRGGISAFVVSSVLWGLYAFLRHPDDWSAAVGLAISAGGDVDTTAALTGALVGARHGIACVPAEAARKLTDRGEWGYDALTDLARQCHAQTVANARNEIPHPQPARKPA